eukprot:219866_1
MNELYSKHAERGLDILAFPCNQFGSQEPGSDAQIQEFVKEKGVKFPVFAKIDVNGIGADPLYVWLKEKQGGYLGGSIKWNFTKFLVDANGEAISRYAPTTNPLSIEGDIEKLLNA